MKRYIGGKIYDTDTAELIDRKGNCASRTGPSFISEALYRKRTGEFFLHGHGGEKTKYAVRTESNTWIPGEQIIPLSYPDALEWARDNLPGDVFTNVFGDPREDPAKKSATYYLSKTNIRKLRRAASESGLGTSEFLEQLLTKIFEPGKEDASQRIGESVTQG